MNIRALWEELAQEKAETGEIGIFSRRIMNESKLDINLAIEKPFNRKLLLLTVKETSFDSSTRLPSCSGFDVERITLGGASNKTAILQLAEKKQEDDSIFVTLVEDILSFTPNGGNERECVTIFLNRLHHWQVFFKKNALTGLDPERQRGLFGELCFLRFLLDQKVSGPMATESWVGPTGANQDFFFDGCAIEVKVTVANQEQHLQIASERQLDVTGASRLFLMHHSLDMRNGGEGETLNHIVEALRKELAHLVANLQLFNDRLTLAGYLDQHAELYAETRYTHREVNYFDVQNEFPRVVEADLREGVGNVRYRITVSQCKKFLVPGEEVIGVIKAKR